MARHRNVRKLNYDEECDFDDVYGRSVEDAEYCISPGTAAEFMYDRASNTHSMSAFIKGDQDHIPEEESEEESAHHEQKAPVLSGLDEVRLRSCLDELHNIVGDSIAEGTLMNAVLTNDFNVEKALNAVLSNKAPPEVPKPQRERRERRPREDEDYCVGDAHSLFSDDSFSPSTLDHLLSGPSGCDSGCSVSGNNDELSSEVLKCKELDENAEIKIDPPSFATLNLSSFLPRSKVSKNLPTSRNIAAMRIGPRFRSAFPSVPQSITLEASDNESDYGSYNSESSCSPAEPAMEQIALERQGDCQQRERQNVAENTMNNVMTMTFSSNLVCQPDSFKEASDLTVTLNDDVGHKLGSDLLTIRNSKPPVHNQLFNEELSSHLQNVDRQPAFSPSQHSASFLSNMFENRSQSQLSQLPATKTVPTLPADLRCGVAELSLADLASSHLKKAPQGSFLKSGGLSSKLICNNSPPSSISNHLASSHLIKDPQGSFLKSGGSSPKLICNNSPPSSISNLTRTQSVGFVALPAELTESVTGMSLADLANSHFKKVPPKSAVTGTCSSDFRKVALEQDESDNGISNLRLNDGNSSQSTVKHNTKQDAGPQVHNFKLPSSLETMNSQLASSPSQGSVLSSFSVYCPSSSKADSQSNTRFLKPSSSLAVLPTVLTGNVAAPSLADLANSHLSKMPVTSGFEGVSVVKSSSSGPVLGRPASDNAISSLKKPGMKTDCELPANTFSKIMPSSTEMEQETDHSSTNSSESDEDDELDLLLALKSGIDAIQKDDNIASEVARVPVLPNSEECIDVCDLMWEDAERELDPVPTAKASPFGLVACLHLKVQRVGTPHGSRSVTPTSGVCLSGAIVPFEFDTPSPDDLVFAARNN